MRKIKLEGKTYELFPDDQRRYDSYYYRGDVHNNSPVDTRIIGYVVEGKQKIAVCKHDSKLLRRAMYIGVGVAGAAVLVFSIAVIGFDVQVPHWDFNRTGDDVIGELDDGVVRASKRLTYSQYATYNGANVSVFVTGRGGEVSVEVDGKTSEYVPLDNTYSIPLDLDLTTEGVAQGILHYKHGENISDYPLVVEYLITVSPELPVGNIEDNYAAQEQIKNQPVLEGMLKDPQAEEDDNEETVDVDFENFPVIAPKELKKEEVEETEDRP